MDQKTPSLGPKSKLAAGVLALALLATGAMEGRKYVPYRDPIANGVLTVCNGHTGLDIDPSKTYTDEECDALLLNDWFVHEAALDRCLPPKAELTDGERMAYTDLLFNIGPGSRRAGRSGVCVQKTGAPSSIMRYIALEDRARACQSIELFQFAGGKDCRLSSSGCPGIPDRRRLQRQVCTGELTPFEFCKAVQVRFGTNPAACAAVEQL